MKEGRGRGPVGNFVEYLNRGSSCLCAGKKFKNYMGSITPRFFFFYIFTNNDIACLYKSNEATRLSQNWDKKIKYAINETPVFKNH